MGMRNIPFPTCLFILKPTFPSFILIPFSYSINFYIFSLFSRSCYYILVTCQCPPVTVHFLSENLNCMLTFSLNFKHLQSVLIWSINIEGHSLQNQFKGGQKIRYKAWQEKSGRIEKIETGMYSTHNTIINKGCLYTILPLPNSHDFSSLGC